MAIEFVTRVVQALQLLNIPYMVVGSFSSNAYGRPRSTKDADFVIELGQASVTKLANALGDDFRLDPQMSFETITSTSRFILLHASTAFTIELFLLSNDPHDQERFKRRRLRDIGDGKQSFVPSPEDVVVTKLRWSKGGKRMKDVEDAKGIIEVQAGHLDLQYIYQWCDVHGTRDLLNVLMK